MGRSWMMDNVAKIDDLERRVLALETENQARPTLEPQESSMETNNQEFIYNLKVYLYCVDEKIKNLQESKTMKYNKYWAGYLSALRTVSADLGWMMETNGHQGVK